MKIQLQEIGDDGTRKVVDTSELGDELTSLEYIHNAKMMIHAVAWARGRPFRPDQFLIVLEKHGEFLDEEPVARWGYE